MSAWNWSTRFVVFGYLFVLFGLIFLLLVSPAIRSVLLPWQTGLGALMGFLGLMVGALYTSILASERENASNVKSTISLAAALHAEISVNSVLLNKIQKLVLIFQEQNHDREILKFGPTLKTVVYDSNIKELGRLPIKLLEDIVYFYSNYTPPSKFIEAFDNLPDTIMPIKAKVQIRIRSGENYAVLAAELSKRLQLFCEAGKVADEKRISELHMDLERVNLQNTIDTTFKHLGIANPAPELEATVRKKLSDTGIL